MASNSDSLQFTSRKRNNMGCIPIKKLLHSSCPQEDSSQVNDKGGFSAVFKSSSSRNFETLPDICTFCQVDRTKAHQDQVSTAYTENTLPPTVNNSKETSGEKDSVYKGNTMVKNASSYGNLLPEETGLTSKNRLFFSQEIRSKGNFPVPIDIFKYMYSTKFLTPTSDTKLDPTVLGGDINKSNAKEVIPVELSFDKPKFETDASLLVPEDIEIPEFRHDGEKSKQSENLRRFVSMSTKEPYNDNTITCLSTSGSKSSNKPLKETLKVLENWSSRGLDTVFNRPAKVSSEEFGTKMEKDLEQGLNVLKEMTTRMYILMRAVNQLPDIDHILIPEFESIRDDFNKNLLHMWNIIDAIKLQVYEDYKNIKLSRDNASGKSTEDTEEKAKPNVFITNAYTIVTEKLPLLRNQLVGIREKVRIICSEIERFL